MEQHELEESIEILLFQPKKTLNLSDNAYTLFVCLRLRNKHLHSKYYHQSLIDITAMYNFADFSKAKWEIKKT